MCFEECLGTRTSMICGMTACTLRREVSYWCPSRQALWCDVCTYRVFQYTGAQTGMLCGVIVHI